MITNNLNNIHELHIPWQCSSVMFTETWNQRKTTDGKDFTGL